MVLRLKRFNTLTLIKLFVTFSVIFSLLLFLIMNEFSSSFERPKEDDAMDDSFERMSVTVTESHDSKALDDKVGDNEYSQEDVDDENDDDENDDEKDYTEQEWWKPFKNLVIEKLEDMNAPGEQSKGIDVNVSELLPNERHEYEEGYRNHGFNQYATDRISLQRSIQDPRNPECSTLSFNSTNYLDTSVIVIFYNEALSTLLRTAYSAVNRSPPHLLKEVILVDDFSSHEELQEPLRRYVDMFLPKVKLLRTPGRLGLMNARLYGANASTAMTYTFLDSHCECTEDIVHFLFRGSCDLDTGWVTKSFHKDLI